MRHLIALILCAGCGASPTVDPQPDAGVPPPPSLRHIFSTAPLDALVKPRVSGAGLRVRRAGELTFTLEVTRDELGVVSKRLVAARAGVETWSLAEAANERFTDFALHPAGDLTLGVERLSAPHDALDLVRVNQQGQVVHRQVLARPATIPATDLAPAFLMKGVASGSVVTGWLPWLRLEARGEDVIAGVLSYADVPGGPSDSQLVSGVLSLGWDGSTFSERWARVVDGPHALIGVAWQYDEFLWLDAATRLVVSVTEGGSIVVGRTLGHGRCVSVSQTFGELTQADCRRLRSYNSPHRYQPFAYTIFSPEGARVATRALAPEALEEFVIFDLEARGDEVAVAGTAVRLGASGAPDYYFEAPSSTPLSPYDGYLAVLDASGKVREERFVELGRGELLSALSWTEDGLVAAGGADWDRWYGGMSLSRGAQPLLVFAPADGAPVETRTLAVTDRQRHTHLLDLDVRGADVLAVGPADAPMTHSGDASIAPMALGGLELRLR